MLAVEINGAHLGARQTYQGRAEYKRIVSETRKPCSWAEPRDAASQPGQVNDGTALRYIEAAMEVTL